MKIEEAILYCLASQNRRTSESRIKLACILPSEEEEDEVNRGMRTELIAEMINRQQLHIRKDGAEGASIINISSSRDRMSQPQTESQRWHCCIDPRIGCQSG